MTYNKFFSHIYAEDGVWEYAAAEAIRAAFSDSIVVPVRHYKDVFCKKGQDFDKQKNSPKLILAIKQSSFYYSGSEMCDSFGHSNFIYTSEIMNCLYNCEYCYLRGMYPSANIVVFVNQEDTFKAIERVLPAYICVSYDTDLLSLEYLTGFVRNWMNFCKCHPGAEIEVRTKSAAFKYIKDIPSLSNVTLSWTLSPDLVISRFEKGTPTLVTRLLNMQAAMDRGWNVRMCIDPIVKFSGWRDAYKEMAAVIRNKIDLDCLFDISIGAFRLPSDIYRKMLKFAHYSELLAYPMNEIDGGMWYVDDIEIVRYVNERLQGRDHLVAPRHPAK